MALAEHLVAAVVHEDGERVAHIPRAQLAAVHIYRHHRQRRAREAAELADFLVHFFKAGQHGLMQRLRGAVDGVLGHEREEIFAHVCCHIACKTWIGESKQDGLGARFFSDGGRRQHGP